MSKARSDFSAASLAGITDDTGNQLLSADTAGSQAFIVGTPLLRELRDGVANGDFSAAPPDGTAILSDDNPLPYFSWSSATGISAKLEADATYAANGNMLVVTFGTATAAGSTATLTRYQAISGNGNRDYCYNAEAWFGTGTARTNNTTATITIQTYDKDLNALTAAATASTGGLSLANNSLATTYVIPEITAQYIKITLAFAVPTTPPPAQTTMRIGEIRANRGPYSIALTPSSGATTVSQPWIISNVTDVLTIQKQGNTDQLLSMEANTTTGNYNVNITNTNANGINTITAGARNVFDAPYNTANVLRLTATADASQSSTDHALTVGASPTSGQRIKIDTNEMSSFSGTAGATLNLNPSGGAVNINTSQTNNYTVINGSTIQSTGTTTGSNVLQTFVTSDANNRMKIESNGKISWGPGSAGVDTNIYRGGANALATDSTFTANGIESTSAINAAGAMSATNITLSGTNGLRHDTPATTTATTNAAIWVVQSGTQYQLRRNSSSRRYKTNIADADSAVLEAAKKIKARHYTSTIEDEGGATRLGFIAEEIEAAGLTHAVGYDANGRPETIDSIALIAALYHRVNELEERLAALE